MRNYLQIVCNEQIPHPMNSTRAASGFSFYSRRNSNALRALVLGSLLCAVAGLTACRNLVDPRLPPGTVQFTPPQVYTRWWQMTEECSGQSAALESVSWFETPEAVRDPRNGEIVDGYWSRASNRIVLSSGTRLEGSSVRHEMLHALLAAPRHSRGQFLGKCNGVVDCGPSCVSDAGPPPSMDPNSVQVSPDSLEIRVEVNPAVPNGSRDDGMFTVIVTARNAGVRPFVVELPARGAGASRSFSFDVRAVLGGGRLGGELAFDEGVRVFAPGEVKRQVFDFRSGSDSASRAFPPGAYTVRGAYGERWTIPFAFTISP